MHVFLNRLFIWLYLYVREVSADPDPESVERWPCGLSAVSLLSPCGLLVVSLWFPCGLFVFTSGFPVVVSLCSLCGLLVSLWSPCALPVI